MARARNIKPGFFTNEELVELPFHTRLLFIGLWTLCDRAGRMEDRPKRIKMALFPADDIDVDESLNELQASGFLLRYEHDGSQYIQVLAFDKHQNPHKEERQSTIPAPCGHGASTVHEDCVHGANPADSLLLIPDTPKPDKGYSQEFEQAWAAYPKRPGASKADTFKAWSARIKEGVLIGELMAGVGRYASYCKTLGTDPQFIKQPATFFGPGKHYASDWTVSPARAAPARTSPMNNIGVDDETPEGFSDGFH